MKKIAIIGGGDVVDSMSWHVNYTLKKMGYESDIFYLNQNPIVDKIPSSLLKVLKMGFKSIEEFQYKKLIENIIAFQPKLIIVIIRNIPPNVIEILKKELNIKIIFWTGDAFINLERGYALISNYDAWFVKDTYMHKFMHDKARLNVHLIPECCNPNFHKPCISAVFGSGNDITIAGTLYPYRVKILESLVSGFNVEIYGAIPRWIDQKWKKIHTGKYIRLEEKSNIFHSSKINLNTLHYGEIDAGNCRLFEVAGSGGFQICDRKEEIKNYFIEDEEIVFFDTTDELIEKISYYLKHQDEAKIIAYNAFKRAHSEHTYEHRIKKIFKIIDFDGDLVDKK